MKKDTITDKLTRDIYPLITEFNEATGLCIERIEIEWENIKFNEGDFRSDRVIKKIKLAIT